MGELNDILALWGRARERGEKVCLATVVRVAGSSYRKPGARMLVTSGGERAGTISGGCLEAEVSRKIWWLTAQGPSVRQYQSSFDEDTSEIPWGLGCGGTIWVHLEQEPTTVLEAIARSVEAGTPFLVHFQMEPACRPAEVISQTGIEASDDFHRLIYAKLFESRRSTLVQDGTAFLEYLAPPPRLTIFGAGDDAKPIAEFASALGWRITVADGRAHLLQPDKFPVGTELRLLQFSPEAAPLACGPLPKPLKLFSLQTGVHPGELAVVLTHSYEQDRAALAALLPMDLLYLGILGPRHRTARILDELGPALGWTADECFARLHSPIGLDLGARDPAAIALSIVADLQAALTGRCVSVTRDAAPALASDR